MEQPLTRPPWADRGSRHARGYGAEWSKLRLRILRRDGYLCVQCTKEGRASAATNVDHITPKAKGGTDNPVNLRSLCDHHKATKDAEDRGRPLRRRVTYGRDGWPVWPEGR